MYKQIFLAVAALAAVGPSLEAQDQPRRMTPVRGGAPDRGKCTLEVVVDGAAEVEIRGDTATLRNISGALPRWKRFECTGPLPHNPGDFRFAGVDGRGRQQLLRDPRTGGSAIVRIDDSGGGSEGYTFDIFWGNAAPPVQGRLEDRRPDRDEDGFYRDRENAFRGEAWRRHLFSRVREDLDHVQRVAFSSGGDRYRLARAKEELDQLQEMHGRGRYDARQLEDVVRALRQVVEDNRLVPRDREILKDDLDRLLDFRDHSRNYGIR